MSAHDLPGALADFIGPIDLRPGAMTLLPIPIAAGWPKWMWRFVNWLTGDDARPR